MQVKISENEITRMVETIEEVSTWADFRQQWTSRQNFILRGDVFAPRFAPPPLEPLIDEMRRNRNTRMLHATPRGVPPHPPFPEFADMPME